MCRHETFRRLIGSGRHLIPSRGRVLRLLVFFLFGLSLLLHPADATLALADGPPGPRKTDSATPANNAAILPDLPPPPLPTDCTSLIPPGEEPPAACVFGYVFLNGLPVSGASVSITSETAILNVSTQSGPASTEPYFAAALTTSPLSVPLGELVKVGATHSGQSNTTTFATVENGQQVDVRLSSTCGPTSVPGGLIGANTTWSSDCGPYIVTGNLLVQNGITLTVEAGTTVRFNADVALQVDGVLDAQGQANAMITFTSNGTGAPGDWGYILLRETVDPQPYDYLTYVLIEYAGGVSVTNNAALLVDRAWPVLHDITVRHSASDGVRFYNSTSGTFGAIGAISSATIYDNAGWGIYANSTSLSAANSALYVYHNAAGGIYINGAGPVWLMGSLIRENGGRGIEAGGSALDLYVTNCRIHGHSASYGGGIYVTYATLSLSDSWVFDNAASGSTDGGGIYCGSNGTCLVQYNVISDNSAGDQGGGIHVAGGSGSIAVPHKIQHNIFSGNAAASGGGLAVTSGPVSSVVGNNAFLHNTATGHGAAIYVTRNISITENTILHNTAGLGLGAVYATSYPVINSNNIYGNSDYDLYDGNAQGGANLNAEDNWWGTSNSGQIMAHIWDWFDNPSLGLVDYDPWLASHSLLAPISPPVGLTASSDGITITLGWSPSPESDLAGYKLYYDISSGYPYEGTGGLEGDSPVDVGDTTSLVLTGLPLGRLYYFAVTSYDTSADGDRDQTSGNESWFSAEGTAELLAPPVPPVVTASILDASTLRLSWSKVTTNIYDVTRLANGYRIYWDSSPYWIPTEGSQWMSLDEPGLPDPVTQNATHLGDPGVHHFYIVRAVYRDLDMNELESLDANRLGEFEFSLTPGN